MILYNSTLVLWSLVFVLFYGWFAHVILAWNYFELMLKILHQ